MFIDQDFTHERSSGVAGCEPLKLCAKLPMVPIFRCWLVCRVGVPLTGRLKFQFAAPPRSAPHVLASTHSSGPNNAIHHEPEDDVPNFPFGNRAEANVAFRACACCGAGNPDMPRSGCGPDPSTGKQGVSKIYAVSNRRAHASAQPRNVPRDPCENVSVAFGGTVFNTNCHWSIKVLYGSILGG